VSIVPQILEHTMGELAMNLSIVLSSNTKILQVTAKLAPFLKSKHMTESHANTTALFNIKKAFGMETLRKR